MISKKSLDTRSLHNRVFVDMRNNNYAQITCKISQHVDRKSGVLAAKWEPLEDSVQANGNILHRYKKYIYAKAAGALRNLVEDDDFLDYAERYVSGTITTSTFLSFPGLSKIGEIIVNCLVAGGSIISLGNFINFKDMVLEAFDEAGGYQGKDNDGNRIYSNGVCLTSYMSDGLMFFDVEPWTNSIAKGAAGEVGDWA